MALKLDNNLIDELGLGALPEQEKQLLLRQIYEKLEMNVGVRLADQMSNEQLDEFEKFVDANDDKGAFQWLESNFPNYKDVVNEEFEKLKAEIKQYAPQMLAAAQHNSQQAANASVIQQPGVDPGQHQGGFSGQIPQGPPQPQYQPHSGQYAPPQTGQYSQPQPGQYQPYPGAAPQPGFGPTPQTPQYQSPFPTQPGVQNPQSGMEPDTGQGQYPPYPQPPQQ